MIFSSCNCNKFKINYIFNNEIIGQSFRLINYNKTALSQYDYNNQKVTKLVKVLILRNCVFIYYKFLILTPSNIQSIILTKQPTVPKTQIQ